MTKDQLEAVLKGFAELAANRQEAAWESESNWAPDRIRLEVCLDDEGNYGGCEVAEVKGENDAEYVHDFASVEGFIAYLHKNGIQVTGSEHQPPPKRNNSRPVWEMVIEDMGKRDHVGRQRYGVPLQAHNGRDALRDAYEEALDLCVYLRQAIEERDAARPGG